MQLKRSLPLALASLASAQSLTDALASQNSSISTLNGLLQSSGIGAALSGMSNITILAPNNAALNALLNDSAVASMLMDPGAVSALLSYHVINGTYPASSFTNMSAFAATHLTNETYANITGGQRVEAKAVNGNVTFFSALKQNASVVTANVNFTGGVIHVIDGVLSIPMNISDTLANSNLTAAAGAIRTAGLEQALGGMRDVTIFAPNNDAFSAIGNLLPNISTSDLTKILGYHVVNGTVAYSSSLGNQTVTASDGTQLKITVENGNVFVNAARVTVPDVLISNGVVHVINQVLNPANSTGVPDASATTAPPAFSGGATGTAGVPFTSGVATPTSTFPAASTTAASTAGNAAVPMKTGAVGAAALFGGAAILANL